MTVRHFVDEQINQEPILVELELDPIAAYAQEEQS